MAPATAAARVLVDNRTLERERAKAEAFAFDCNNLTELGEIIGVDPMTMTDLQVIKAANVWAKRRELTGKPVRANIRPKSRVEFSGAEPTATIKKFAFKLAEGGSESAAEIARKIAGTKAGSVQSQLRTLVRKGRVKFHPE